MMKKFKLVASMDVQKSTRGSPNIEDIIRAALTSCIQAQSHERYKVENLTNCKSALEKAITLVNDEIENAK